MLLLHSILNLVALLLWVNWRGMGFKEYVPYRSTLVHTLRSAEERPSGRWRYLVGLAALLYLRGMLYQQVGPALKWVPTLDLGVLTLPFRSDQPWRMMLYSGLTFLSLLAAFHLGLLLLSIVNRTIPDTQPVQHLIRLHLGRIERWPTFAKLLLPLAILTPLWLSLQPLLVAAGLIPVGAGFRLMVEQGLVLSLASFLFWKPLVLVILLVHLVSSYIHLGHSPLLEFTSDTARRLLTLLRWLPLQWQRIDFAPAVLAALVWSAGWGVERGLSMLFGKLPL
jgi:uncharacterized protein YggT (Ycf19 family)